MANSSNPFNSRGTRIYHGVAAAAISVGRLIMRDGAGKLVPCTAGNRACGVSPANYVAGDDVDYHRLGICTVETDGSATVGANIKAISGGKGGVDIAPSFTTAGVVLWIDVPSGMATVELYF
jgi:hypothetical protein